MLMLRSARRNQVNTKSLVVHGFTTSSSLKSCNFWAFFSILFWGQPLGTFIQSVGMISSGIRTLPICTFVVFSKYGLFLHFNEIVNPTATQVKDALFKIRPLLNILKITFPSYLRLGDEIGFDEISTASQLRYGADIIFYNPTKPGGKYHFWFYLLCCSTMSACIHLRMHAENNHTNFGDGFFEKSQPQQDEEHEEGDDESVSNKTQENRVKDTSIRQILWFRFFSAGNSGLT